MPVRGTTKHVLQLMNPCSLITHACTLRFRELIVLSDALRAILQGTERCYVRCIFPVESLKLSMNIPRPFCSELVKKLIASEMQFCD